MQKKYCPVGDMQGFFVTTFQLNEFAEATKSKYLDAVIPLEGMEPEDQMKLVKECSCNESYPDDVVYWETDSGSHGWCHEKCGNVLQYG